MPTGVYPRSQELKRRVAESVWRYHHEEKQIWRKDEQEVS